MGMLKIAQALGPGGAGGELHPVPRFLLEVKSFKSWKDTIAVKQMGRVSCARVSILINTVVLLLMMAACHVIQ